MTGPDAELNTYRRCKGGQMCCFCALEALYIYCRYNIWSLYCHILSIFSVVVQQHHFPGPSKVPWNRFMLCMWIKSV